MDAEEAGLLEMSAAHGNETFYFHSDDCKKAFESEPAKYVRTERPATAAEDRFDQPGPQRTWADLLDPVTEGQGLKEGGAKPIEVTRDAPLTNYATTPEVVDWDGPDKEGAPPPEWEKGWGGFPGAKYLGIQPDASEAAAKSGSEALPPSGAAETGAAGVEDLLKELDELEQSLKNSEQPANIPPEPAGRP